MSDCTCAFALRQRIFYRMGSPRTALPPNTHIILCIASHRYPRDTIKNSFAEQVMRPIQTVTYVVVVIVTFIIHRQY